MMAIPVCSDAQQVLIKAVVDTIIGRTQPERIICYGVRTEAKNRWGCFSENEKEQCFITLDLLVITHKTDKRERDQMMNLIESLGCEGVTVIAVAHSVDALKAGLEQRNPFFISVYNKGIVLYGSEEPPVEFSHASSNKVCCKPARLERARSFYKAACDCTTDENFETAMFLLHQTVELSCAELLNCRMGYKATTHSLRKLFSLSENISPRLTDLFPEAIDAEQNLFNQLHRAYVDVRYKENYSIDADDVFTLSERVHELLLVVEDLCGEGRVGSEVQAAERDALPIPEFSRIDISVPCNIILRKGSKPAIQIETEVDAHNFFQYEVKNERLYIYVKSNTKGPILSAVIHVTYVVLSGLVVDQSGTITCEDIVEADTVGIIQNGNGMIELALRVNSLDATVTKSGTLKLFGTANYAKVLNTGPGVFDGTDLEVSEAAVSLIDTGGITLCVEDELTLSLRGTGLLNIKGEPRLKKIEIRQ